MTQYNITIYNNIYIYIINMYNYVQCVYIYIYMDCGFSF